MVFKPSGYYRGKRRPRILMWSAFFLSLASGLVGVYSAIKLTCNPTNPGLRMPFVSPPFGGRDLVSILVLGVDDRGGVLGRSDAMMLVFVGPKTNKVAILHIPRDSRVRIPGHGVDKINAAFAIRGAELARETVEYFIGEPIDFFVTLKVEGSRKLVDLVGGVDLFVEKDMNYVDRSQGLYINLERGYQRLDGEEAMEYVRFRHDRWGDIGRIERQKKFLKALVRKLLSPQNLPKLPKIVLQARECLDTDMMVEDMLDLVRVVRKVKPEEVLMETLPGRPTTMRGVCYWLIEEEGACHVLSRLLTYVQTEKDEQGKAAVEVLNGCGVPGVATRVAEVLRAQGFEIQRVDNADRYDYDVTTLFVQGDALLTAEEVRNILGLGEVRRTKGEEVKVTVIVGKDLARFALEGGS